MAQVAYIDPGNWAAAIEAGSRFGYQLVWVVVVSHLMAILLQTLAARLGLVTGKHLAQVCFASAGGAGHCTHPLPHACSTASPTCNGIDRVVPARAGL